MNFTEVFTEVEKENPKTTGNPHGCKDYSTSQDFDVFDKEEEPQEGAFSAKKEDKNDSQKPVLDIPFEVENVEVEQ